jgi:hypothetical protein
MGAGWNSRESGRESAVARNGKCDLAWMEQRVFEVPLAVSGAEAICP